MWIKSSRAAIYTDHRSRTRHKQGSTKTQLQICELLKSSPSPCPAKLLSVSYLKRIDLPQVPHFLSPSKYGLGFECLPKKEIPGKNTGFTAENEIVANGHPTVLLTHIK